MRLNPSSPKTNRAHPIGCDLFVAVGEGFEPSRLLTVYTISNRARSTGLRHPTNKIVWEP